jgi:hypothetical protein
MFRKYQAVLTSRWKALIWAAGVCLTAYCTVPSPDEPETAQARQTQQTQPQPRHVSPWALQKD